jgi:hypothetical protein
MDLRRLRKGEWIAGVSGFVLFVSLFLPWYRQRPADDVEDPFMRELADRVGSSAISAWEAFAAVDILLAAVAVLGVTLLVVTAVQPTAAVGVAMDALVTLVVGVVLVIVVVRVINFPAGLEVFDRPPFEVSRTGWIVIGPLATLGVFVGALVAMRDERLSEPGRPTDPTGVPVDAPPEIETLPAP